MDLKNHLKAEIVLDCVDKPENQTNIVLDLILQSLQPRREGRHLKMTFQKSDKFYDGSLGDQGNSFEIRLSK